ncbi:hypothetical protein V1477_001262 [Vespula maculifrons]|uniref:Uncharacterized protein n=1 Tax=Vespula maculifrons TaxID=7453 RepID=A0ABD2CZB2_VESMC
MECGGVGVPRIRRWIRRVIRGTERKFPDGQSERLGMDIKVEFNPHDTCALQRSSASLFTQDRMAAIKKLKELISFWKYTWRMNGAYKPGRDYRWPQ